MAWVYPISMTSPDTTIGLGEINSVYVLAGVTVTSNVVGFGTIYGIGSNHKAIIEGTVAGQYALWLGEDAFLDSKQDVQITETGRLVSANGYGLVVVGHDSAINNAGTIQADRGILLYAEFSSRASTIENSGTIRGVSTGIEASGSTQQIDFTNTGVLSATVAYSAGFGVDHIVNKGTISGTVDLYDDNDYYDGRAGKMSGAVNGGDGEDTLYGGTGKETLNGEADNDLLSGGKGADMLTGGTGTDTFLFNSIADSKVKASGRDTIVDFSQSDHDRIDLHSIDADTTKTRDQAFTFIGTAGFHHKAGELRHEKTATDTFVYGDVNGDGKADFAIRLQGLISLHGGDFTL
jgi:Ca2+-binding RTX toxin-like protein